ncbi:hypothetical protein FSP39_018668, partial [Pinctada imbricata]
ALFFSLSFQGEKNNGFFVLQNNMKQGSTSAKEFIDFLRESCTVEESYSKLLNKLAKTSANSAHVGTFQPFWNVIKVLMEKLSTLHSQLVHSLNDIIKDVLRYNDEQHKKHKAVKEKEHGTHEVVMAIQQTTNALHKAKVLYHARFMELERMKRDNASAKEQEKQEQKCKKANDEYRGYVEKYANIRNDFETKMLDSCKHFQEVEEEHICQMKDFIDTYAKAWENQHALVGQVHQEFRQSCDELTVQKLLETFINSKTTGTEKPGPMEYVEPDLSSLPPPRAMSPEPAEHRDSISDKSKQGFLKNKKKKEKKKKKKEGKDDKDDKSDTQSQTTPEVDDEGYSIRPDDMSTNNGDKNSWYSSDSESDSDDEARRKIKVEIKPLGNNDITHTGTVDDIKISVSQLRLSPTVITQKKRSQTPIDKKMMMKRSQSESDTLDVATPSQDLLNLDFFASSSASTPSGVKHNLPSPLSPMADTALHNSLSSHSAGTPFTTQHNSSDVFNSNGTSLMSDKGSLLSPSSQMSQGLQAPALPSRPAPPRPAPQIPSRPSPSAGRTSPASFMSRSESSSSVTFNTTSMPVGSTRGPSPLTIGMSDTIPLAVAFTETVNSFFKGTDAFRCMVRITGNVMMSFPAGVVKVFMENPSPANLSFKIKNTSRLEQVLLNKQLLTQLEDQDNPDDTGYTFNMAALVDHLRQQGEENRTASYFNIDILKYQVKTQPGVESTPMPVITYWKCDSSTTDYRLDYKYNPNSLSSPSTLKNIAVKVSVSGDVSNMQSIPSGNWNAETQKATWKLNDLSELSEDGSQGSIRAKFELNNGPSKPATTSLHFICDGASLSGVDFELIGSGYRISLAKKRFGAGTCYL